MIKALERGSRRTKASRRSAFGTIVPSPLNQEFKKYDQVRGACLSGQPPVGLFVGTELGQPTGGAQRRHVIARNRHLEPVRKL